MARLDECWNCTKYRTSDCPGFYGLGTGNCNQYEPKDDALEEEEASAQEAKELAEKEYRSIGNKLRIIFVAALTIFLTWYQLHPESDGKKNYEIENGENGVEQSRFLVDKSPRISRSEAEAEGMEISGPIAWRLPESEFASKPTFETHTQKDGNVVYSLHDRYGITQFTVEPFQMEKYNCEKFDSLWNHWQERLDVEKECGGELHGSSNYTLLEGGRCFQWMGRRYNVPHTSVPDDDQLFILGAVYLPEAQVGLYLHYISHSGNEDLTYDIYHSVQALK